MANLIGLREAEGQCIQALGFIDGRMPTLGLKRLIAKLWTRFHLDTGNLAEALEQSRRLVELAREAGSVEELAKALSWQAMVLRERSEFARAIELYDQAEPLTENRIFRAELWQEKGLTYTYMGQYHLAEQLLEKSLEVFRPLGATEKTATAVNDLGVCYYQQKRHLEAMGQFHEAIRLYEKIGYKLGMATTAGNLVNIHLHLGEMGQALALAKSCLEWGKEIEDQITIGLGHERLGSVYQLLGMAERARQHLEQAGECAAMTGDFVVRGLVLGMQAEVLADLGRTGEAEAALAKAEELGRVTGEEMLAFRMEVRRAWLDYRRGDFGQAVERWKRLISRAEAAGDRKSANEARLEKAACLLALGKAESAKRCFEEIAPDEGSSIFWLLRHRALGVEIGRAAADGAMSEEHGARAREIAGRLLEKNPEPWIREGLLSADPLKKLSNIGCL